MKLMIVLSILLCSCTPQWIPDRRPETVEESKAVAELEIKLMEQVPHSLSGHDQDWDDAIDAAHKVAVDTICKERLYEYQGGNRTGRVKEVKP